MFHRIVRGSLFVLAVGCNSILGMDEVDLRNDPASGGAGAGAAGGTSGVGGDQSGGAGGQGGDAAGPTLCQAMPADNIVLDGSFEQPLGEYWSAYNGYLYQMPFSAADSCDGDSYLDYEDYSYVAYVWGSGDKQVLFAANTECVEWSYSARAASPDVYFSLTLAFEGTPYVVNELTGLNGLYMQSQTWTLYQGECRLTLPDFTDHINVFISLDEDNDPNDPDIVADFDSLVVRPVPCTGSTPPCDVQPQ
ncbi:MAG: hypothetical protein U0271_39935 [Polyangiaceae bacterium]